MVGMIIRRQLSAALVHLLQARGVENPETAVQVLGRPYSGVPIYAVVLNGSSRTIVIDVLRQITGRLHPTVADMCVLTEQEALDLIQKAATLFTGRIQPHLTC
jgi:hypothetical protein